MKHKLNIGIFTFIITVLFNCISNNNSQTNDIAKELNELISIPNVFPEKGLTDPHTIIVDGKLYVFCGHDKSWDSEDAWIMDRWEIWSTDNLIDWTKESEILPKDTYIGDLPNCFAGDIISRNGKYYWYFSNRNVSTGVMVADSPVGSFIDALKKPLLPKGIVPVHAYDPEIFEENGTYTIIFGAGHYYAATLAEDMISLADEPQSIKVFNKEGKDIWTADKACTFKRNGKYYLIWESKYAMADSLRGPYTFMGESLKGGHCNVFQWDGQYYALLENKDISLFYRGVSLKPLLFNDDGTIKIPEDDSSFPANGRAWAFEHSRMGWRGVMGTEVKWDSSGYIHGEITANSTIESSMWLLTNLDKYQKLILKMSTTSGALQAKISIASTTPKGAFWQENDINWEDEDHILIDYDENGIFSDTLDLSELPNLEHMLKRLRIEPALNADKGIWKIDYISVE